MIYLGVRQIGRFFALGLLPWALQIDSRAGARSCQNWAEFTDQVSALDIFSLKALSSL